MAENNDVQVSTGSVAPDQIPFGLPAIKGVTYGDSVLDEVWFWAAVAAAVYFVFIWEG